MVQGIQVTRIRLGNGVEQDFRKVLDRLQQATWYQEYGALSDLGIMMNFLVEDLSGRCLNGHRDELINKNQRDFEQNQ